MAAAVVVTIRVKMKILRRGWEYIRGGDGNEREYADEDVGGGIKWEGATKSENGMQHHKDESHN